MSSRSLLTALSALIAISAGWGVFWMIMQGVDLAFHQDGSGQTAAVTQASDQAAEPVLSVTVAPPAADPNSLTILMGGDIMFDRGVRQLGQAYGYDSLFANITPLFKTADIVVANLEGPVTSNQSKTLLPNGTYGSQLTFTFATTTPAALVKAGVNLVSLANNHTDNFGQSGYKETQHWLDAAGLAWFGDPWNSTSTERIVCQKGMCIAFVGYHAFIPGFDRIVKEVKRLSDLGDFVIVMPHWGVEYSPHSTADQEAKARALVAAGADAIIGSHPHVVEDHEWIGSVPVYYSLGNLLFDQYFSTSTMSGELVEMRLNKTGAGIHLDRLRTYEVSTASKKGITASLEPSDGSR